MQEQVGKAPLATLTADDEARRLIEGLHQAAEAISGATSVHEICQSLAGHFNRLVRADRTVMYLVDQAQQAITLGVGAGHVTETDLQMTYAEFSSGISGLVVRSGQPALSLSADDGVEPEATRKRRIQANAGALIVAPLSVKGEVIGTVTTMNQVSQRPFTPQDVDALMTLATLAATAIQNVRLFEETQAANRVLARRALQLETSSQVGQQITSLLDLDALLTQVVHLIQTHFNYYFVGVWLVADQPEAVILRAGTGRTGDDLRGERLPMSTASIVVKVCQTGRPRMEADVRHALDYLPLAHLTEAQAELAWPLRSGEKIFGALDILSDHADAGAFSADDQVLLQTLADQIAIAIRNAQLYKAEQHRRYLAEALEQAGRELISNLDLREVPRRILEQLATVTPYERSQLILLQGEELSVVSWRGFPDEWQGGGIAISESDTYRQVLESGRPVCVAEAAGMAGWAPGQGSAVNIAWLGVPLIVKDRVIGLIGMSRTEAVFTPQEVTLASTFAGQAAIALENARLYDETARFSELMERMVENRVTELHEAMNILERLDKTKSKFIEVAAHELRTPLTLVKGYGDMINAYPAAKDPEIQPLVQGILAGSTRLHEIINSMLDVAKIDSQTLNMRRAPVKLSKVIHPIVTGLEPALQERRLALTVTGLDDVPLMMADIALLHKAFWHLIVNAIKYTPDGGSINVSGNVIASDPEEAAVEVVVRDTGIGIAPEHQKLIFEKFYQTGEVSMHSSGRTKFKGGGSGLGLSIVKGIVQAHGGQIWVESPGYDEAHCPGSQFHVLLPLALTV